MPRYIQQCVRAGLKTTGGATAAVVLILSVKSVKVSRQRCTPTKVHTLAAQDAMIRPVAFTWSYWLRRRHALKDRLLRLYLQTGMPHISQSGIRLRFISLTQTYTMPVYHFEDLQIVQGIMRDVAEYVKCSKQVMSEPMCLDTQWSQPLRERLMVLWTSSLQAGSERRCVIEASPAISHCSSRPCTGRVWQVCHKWSWTPMSDNDVPAQQCELHFGLLTAKEYDQITLYNHCNATWAWPISMCTQHTDVTINAVAVCADLPRGEARMRPCDEILMIKASWYDTNHHHRPENELDLTALAAFASHLDQKIAAAPVAISAHWTDCLEVC